MRKYRLVAKKGEGTFSEVLKAQNVKDGKYHAIKCMKNRFESIDQVNNLREIQALRRLSPHEHIITLEEVLYDQPTGRLALVFELMDANLYELIRGRKHYLNGQLIKGYMWQLMKSLDHMHRKGIFHRDIKPENILIESSTDFGRGLKLADFGSCRGIYSKQPYTEYISTRWYRAPECLLTDGYYGPEMDLWGAGCVMFEITSLYPLFPGTNEVDQISRIHKVLGTPSAEVLQKFKSKGASHISFDFPPTKGVGIAQLIPHASPDAVDLIVKLLKYDSAERISAREAMRHPYFKETREEDARKAAMLQNEAMKAQQQQQMIGNPNSVHQHGGNADYQKINKSGNASKNFKLSQEITALSPNVAPKALPSIGSGPDPTPYKQQTNVNYSENIQKTDIKTSNPPLFGNDMNNSQNVIPSSLPPIASMNNSNSKYQDLSALSRSNRSLQQQQQQQQPSQQQIQQKRRRKKTGGYIGQEIQKTTTSKKNVQNTEQVLRTYGLSGKSVLTNSSDMKTDVKIDGKPAGGAASTFVHSNRQYIQKK